MISRYYRKGALHTQVQAYLVTKDNADEVDKATGGYLSKSLSDVGYTVASYTGLWLVVFEGMIMVYSQRMFDDHYVSEAELRMKK